MEATREVVGSPMRLTEHLEEDQEPFDLQTYLIERGFTITNNFFYSQPSVGCFSSSSSTKKNKNKLSEIRKAVCEKILYIGKVVRLRRHHVPDTESSSTELGQASPSMDDGNQSSQIQPSHQTNESAADKMIQCTMMIEENKQSSPDSVLEEIHNGGLFKKPTDDSILSASLWGLIIPTHKQSTCSRYISSKMALQQTRQLLIDCVREAVESHTKTTGHFLMGPEKLGKIMCDNLKVWNRPSATGKKITRMLTSDLGGTFQEWDTFEGIIEDIVKEVGDQILEQIQDEIVEQVIALYTCKTTKV